MPLDSEGLQHVEERFRALPAPLADIGAGLLAPRRRAPVNTFEDRQRREREFKAACERLDTLSDEDRARMFAAVHPDQADAIEAAWQLLMQLPYQSGILRKGFRAPHLPRCTRQTRGKWLNDLLIFTVHHRWDMATMARGVGLRYGLDHMAGIITAAAMNDDLFEILRRVVNGTEPGAEIGRQTIAALLCCARPDAWELVEKLLLAAQRQEGLRQIILENIDLAHPEAFRRMLHLIRAENLTRFAATARALAVWFGMPVDSAEQKRMDGIVGALIACLEDPDHRRRALASSDVETVYVALWSEAFEDAIAAIGVAAPLLRDERVERRYAAVHLLVQLALPEATEVVADSLADPDLRVALRASAAFQKPSGVNCPDAFERLEALLARVPKLRELEPLGWDWNKTVADPAAVADLLLTWRADRSFERYEPHLGMLNPEGRIALLKSIQTAAKSGGARGARPIIVELLGDSSSNVREIAFQTIAGVGMLPDDVPAVESLLSRKASDLRRGAIWLLLRQSESARQASAERLAAASDPLMRQAGQEMLEAMKSAAAPVRPPTLEEGLGLIDPKDRTPLATPRAGLPVQLISDASLRLVESLDALVQQHRETVVHWEVKGNKFQELLGNLQHFPLPGYGVDLPLREFWENWWLNRPADLRDPDGLELLRALAIKEPQSAEYGPGWQKTVAEDLYRRADFKYRKVVFAVLSWFLLEPLPPHAPDFLMDAMETIYCRIPPEAVAEQTHRLVDWRNWSGVGKWLKVSLDCRDRQPQLWTAAHWKRLWPLLRWQDEGIPGQARMHPPLNDLLRAWRAGAATEADVIEQLMAAEHHWDLQRLTKRKPVDILAGYPELATFVNRCRDRLVEVELQRGDLPTIASAKVLALSSVYGGALALSIVKALGNEPLTRGWIRNNQGKSAVLSHLLRVCLPRDTDTPEEFRKQVKASGIPVERLIDLAIFAPQWASRVEHATGIKALEDAAFWLYAHTRDRQWTVDTEIRELWFAEVSERTPLTQENLLDGAVDVNWFRSMYSAIGAKNWSAVLESAKYASGGGGHKRAEQFAEALLGGIKAKTLAARIREKRHQDSVRAIGLVPLPRAPKAARAEMLERYEAVQAFLKGSRKFGAQRQASEKLAVEIGLENLARTAGFPDAQRLTWAMEAEAVADLRKGSVKVVEGEIAVVLEIDNQGDPQIRVTKGGKPLKEIPAAAKKAPAVAALRTRRTELENQSSRMRVSLEESMVRGDVFAGAEIAEFLQHPLLRPRIEQLVLMNSDGELVWGAGAARAKDDLRIAHPADLLASGDWNRWQQDCFDHERRQPFKQVFRELYPLTAAEKAANRSSRYEGQQVNPRQALALIGARGWVSVPEEGVRRTFHRESISAWVHFLEGFFTPAEIDCLTVEHVVFTRRGQCSPLRLTDVPPRLFSETMRDLDLMVSVAHRGGVDPEATASTVEMRTALLRESMRLLKLANVRLNGAHAFIEGTRASYNVHLGSGVVHRQPGGALCIVPVHSQHRGRLFLPFADDDPKTAEIVSKVLLLAKDETIQDPTILEQLR